MRFYIFIITLLASASSFATPVTWTLNNVMFDNGGAVSGSFVFDAHTNTYSDINIVAMDGYNYYGALLNRGSGGSTDLTAVSDSDDRRELLFLIFEAPLSNLGGVIDLDLGSDLVDASRYISADYYNPLDFNFRLDIVSGTVSAVPVPAAAWLFGSALAGLGWVRRKQTV